MDALIRRIREQLVNSPENVSLKTALGHLESVKGDQALVDVTLDDLKLDFEHLRTSNIWVSDAEEAKLRAELAERLGNNSKTTSSYTNDSNATNGQSSSAGSHPVNSGHMSTSYPLESTILLPTELYETMNYTYFLHMLATEPDSVLPPGKSLLSALARSKSSTHPASSDLHSRVETMVHKAFWDEALESLSNPTPAVQVARLKQLFADLGIALSSLLPADHAVLSALSQPLPPTSFPLRTTLYTLQDMLHALRSRCAPVRDADIDHLLQLLEDPLDVELPKVIIEVVRASLQLAEEMNEDLSQFVLGNMDEEELHAAAVREAVSREKTFVLSIWPVERVRELWSSWLDELSVPTGSSRSSASTVEPPDRPKERFVLRLMQALGTNHAVSCNFPTKPLTEPADDGDHSAPPPPNGLPPPCLFVTPTLLYIQNFLQALVIAASLRALVRLPTTKAATLVANSDSLPEHSFEERVWMLLKAEIDHEPSTDGTKVVNLADEVVRITRLYKEIDNDNGLGVLTAEEEARLRTAVDRTLQPSNPVFLLLQKRLLQTIQGRLTLSPTRDTSGTTSPHTRRANVAPKHMQSGRTVGSSSRRQTFATKHTDSAQREGTAGAEQQDSDLIVQGFEHPVFVSAVGDVFKKLRRCVEWTELVWNELLQ